jgi:hypothetical protein
MIVDCRRPGVPRAEAVSCISTQKCRASPFSHISHLHQCSRYCLTSSSTEPIPPSLLLLYPPCPQRNAHVADPPLLSPSQEAGKRIPNPAPIHLSTLSNQHREHLSRPIQIPSEKHHRNSFQQIIPINPLRVSLVHSTQHTQDFIASAKIPAFSFSAPNVSAVNRRAPLTENSNSISPLISTLAPYVDTPISHSQSRTETPAAA